MIQRDPPKQGLTVRTDRPAAAIRVSGENVKVSAEELGTRAREAEHTWLPRALFLLVPVCAVLVHLLTRRTRRRFPQALYFALHAHAFYFGLAALTVLIGLAGIAALDPWFSPIRAALTFAYLIVAFRTVYGGSWWKSTFRSGALMSSYMLLVLIAIISIYIAALRPYT